MSAPSFKRRTIFSPTQIAGCQLWLDAADSNTLTLSGSSVTAWNDKSGNNYHMNTLTPSARWTGSAVYPTIGTSINGLQTVNFLAQSGLKQGTTLDGVKNLFWVGRIAVPVGSGDFSLFLLGHDSNYDWHGNQYGNKFLYPGLTQSGILNASPTSLFTNDVNAIRDATFSNVNMPTAPNVSILSVAGITGTTRYQGICYDRGDNPGWCGDLAEVIIFSTALSVSDRQTIEGYLAQKWGLTGSLPQFHAGLRSKIYPSLPQNRILNLANTSTFTPLSISGCSMWLDGADVTTFTYSSGTSIATWRDKATGIFGSNASPTNQPTLVSSSQNGNSTVFFDAAAALKYIDIPAWSFGTTSRSLFIVMKNIASAVNSNVLGGYPHWLWDRVNGNNANVWTMVGILQIRPGDFIYFMPRNEYLIIGIIYSSPTMTAYQTGSQVLNYTSLSSFFDATNGYRLGALNNGDDSAPFPYRFYGNIAEFITYNTALTTLQRQQVEGYLAWKWGLQANLPANHPYKSASPTSRSTAPMRAILNLARATIVDPTAKYSALFNAANNPSLTIPASSSLTLGTNDHTIEFWMYQTSRNQYAVSFSYGNTSYFAANNYYMDVGEAGFGFVVGNGSGNWAVNLNGGAARSLNTWRHYAIVRNGTTFTLYIDGISVGSATSSINITAQGDVFRIGNTTTYPINGYISNFRLVNGTAVYTSNFTPPTSPLTAIPNTQILLQGLTDRSPNAFTLTNNGGVTLSIVSPFA